MTMRGTQPEHSRRDFIRQTSAGLAGATAYSVLAGPVLAAKDAEIRIGLVGCGGRGTGAVLDALGAATRVIYPAEGYHTEDVAEGASVKHENITLVALADLFEDRDGRVPDSSRRDAWRLQVRVGVRFLLPRAGVCTPLRAGVVMPARPRVLPACHTHMSGDPPGAPVTIEPVNQVAGSIAQGY